MAENSKVKCNRPSNGEFGKGRKCSKLSLEAVPTEEFHNTSKARVAELRRETTTLNQELRNRATMCEQLSEDNKLLMDELKRICQPWIIENLEANNTETNIHTDW